MVGIQDGVTAFFFIFGLFFVLVGVVGVIRLPDAYSRLHASGKVATLGLLGIIIGVGVQAPVTIPKLVALGLFVAITAPVTSHAIAKADKSYSLRQQQQRDSSISEPGAQPEMTQEMTAATDDA
jgi:multicomponent Na+:H+ antiporter subunit G